MLPELIFLVNHFSKITTVNIELDKIYNPENSDDEYKFFEIAVLNLHWILNSLENIDLSYVDLASMSCQKFFGMKGVGCLIKKENITVEPIIHGGKSTTVFRSGTPATPLIASFAKALRLAYEDFLNNPVRAER